MRNQPKSETDLYSLTAERAILSSIILDNSIMAELWFVLKETHFYNSDNRRIYVAMGKLFNDNASIDIVSLILTLDKSKTQDEWYMFLQDISEIVMSIANYNLHVKIIIDFAMKRELKLFIDMEAKDLFEERLSPEQTLEQLITNASAIKEKFNIYNSKLLSDVLISEQNRIDKIINEGVQSIRIETGFSIIDNKIGGIKAGQLIVIGAGTGVGKTAFAVNIALKVAKRNQRVLFFTLEMTSGEIVRRLTSIYSDIPLKIIENGINLTPEIASIVKKNMQELEKLSLTINDKRGLTILDLCSYAKQIKTKHELDLIVVDYIQLVTAGRRTENKHQDISEVTRKLKILSQDINCPVIALSQVNRVSAIRTDKDKKPKLSDLRESGSIEQDADIVMLLYRDERFRVEAQKYPEIEVIIAKNRNGETGNVKLTYISDCTKFINEGGDPWR